MKKLTVLITTLLITYMVSAQSPEKFSYQAVMRDGEGFLITESLIGMRVSILQGASPVYVETHTPSTDQNAMVFVEIGTGTSTDDFSAIDWANGIFFLKIETDILGGTNYTLVSTTQILSVPYALHAKSAETLTGTISENDPVFNVSAAAGISSGDVDNWDEAYSWGNHADAGYLQSFTEAQILTISNDTIYLTGGSYVKLPAGFSGSWDDLSDVPTNLTTIINNNFEGDYSDLTNVPTNVSAFTNDAGYITNPNDADADPTNELQIISMSNDTIYLNDGGNVKLPAGFSGSWDDLSDVPANLTTIINNNFEGDYSDLTNVPTNVSSFTNDAGYITDFIEQDTTLWKKNVNDIYYNSGYIGIGTSTPRVINAGANITNVNSKLHVIGEIGAQNGMYRSSYIHNYASQIDDTVLQYKVNQNSKNEGVVTGWSIIGNSSSNQWDNLNLTFYRGYSNSYYSGNMNVDTIIPVLHLDGSGNVGIGTTTPVSKLEVAGTIHTTSGGVKFPDGTVQTTAVSEMDGSETIITAGSNIFVSGAGTTISPYVISSTSTVSIAVGDLYEGGIVFYVTPDGNHGLVVALSDQYTAITGENANQFLSDPSKHIGVSMNYTDWRLPDQYEINLLYANRDIINAGLIANAGNTFTSSYYWSSRLNYQGGGSIMIYGYTRRLDSAITNFSTFLDGTNGDAASVRAVRSF